MEKLSRRSVIKLFSLLPVSYSVSSLMTDNKSTALALAGKVWRESFDCAPEAHLSNIRFYHLPENERKKLIQKEFEDDAIALLNGLMLSKTEVAVLASISMDYQLS